MTSLEKIGAKVHRCPFRVITADVTEVNIVIGSDLGNVEAEFAKVRRNALAAGHQIEESDGTLIWRVTEEIHNADASGSDCYVWHDDGNRVRAERVEYTLHTDGRRERRVLRKTWSKA